MAAGAAQFKFRVIVPPAATLPEDSAKDPVCPTRAVGVKSNAEAKSPTLKNRATGRFIKIGGTKSLKVDPKV